MDADAVENELLCAGRRTEIAYFLSFGLGCTRCGGVFGRCNDSPNEIGYECPFCHIGMKCDRDNLRGMDIIISHLKELSLHQHKFVKFGSKYLCTGCGRWQT